MAKLTNLTIWKRNFANFVKLVMQKNCMRIVRILRNLTFLNALFLENEIDVSILARYYLDIDSTMTKDKDTISSEGE